MSAGHDQSINQSINFNQFILPSNTKASIAVADTFLVAWWCSG